MMDPNFFADVIYYVIILAPFLILFWIIKELWRSLQKFYWYRWFLGLDYITLEIKMPKEQLRTPLAMELLFNGLWEPGDRNGWKEDWLNLNTLPILSFEMASIGGSVHFYFWVPERFKPRVESHLYAHFPQAEVVEVPDYTRLISYHPDTHKIMGFDYALTDADPIPIKTYKALGLDKPSKEELKIDPITQTIEVMGSIGIHEQMWLQVVTRPHKSSYTRHLGLMQRIAKAWSKRNPFQLFYGEKTDWSDEVEGIINKLKEKYTPESRDHMLPMGGTITPQDMNFLDMISENASKLAYEVGMRTIYFAPTEHWDSRQASNMGSMFKAYGSGKPYNNFVPAFVAAVNDKWWEPNQYKAIEKLKALMHPDFCERRYFNQKGEVGHGYSKKQYNTFVLSTEELATIYHFPGTVTQAPAFERISSVTSDAPMNLPTE